MSGEAGRVSSPYKFGMVAIVLVKTVNEKAEFCRHFVLFRKSVKFRDFPDKLAIIT
jgi:hypothetical protein